MFDILQIIDDCFPAPFFSYCSSAESGCGEGSQAQHPGGRGRWCEYIILHLSLFFSFYPTLKGQKYVDNTNYGH